MATKKQKHALMLEKRAAREAAVREVGLKSLEAAKEQRKVEEARMWEDAHKVHLKRNRFHDKCEHCAKTKARQAVEKLAKAASLKKTSESNMVAMLNNGADIVNVDGKPTLATKEKSDA